MLPEGTTQSHRQKEATKGREPHGGLKEEGIMPVWGQAHILSPSFGTDRRTATHFDSDPRWS
jgi:hypothetical protein